MGLLAAPGLGGAGPAAPGRQQPTAELLGRVLAADGTGPVEAVAVTLSRGAQTLAVTTTSPTGEFRFPGVPPGRVDLTASKSGWLRSAYLAKWPGAPGAPIVVQRKGLEGLEVRLWRPAVIAGTVRTESGAAVAGAVVRLRPAWALPVDWLAARRYERVAQSNDEGGYRFFDLLPGNYVVAASRIGSAAAAPPVSGRPRTYPTTYYPGTPHADEAVAVSAEAGQERVGTDIRLSSAAAMTVSGVVRDALGQPLDAVALSGHVQGSSWADPIRHIEFGQDGQFKAAGLAPGRYDLLVRADRIRQLRGSATDTPPTLWARIRVTLGTEDVRGLSLILEPGVELAATIESRPPAGDQSRRSLPRLRLTAERFSQVRPDVELSAVSGAPGSLVARNLAPETYLLVADRPGDGGGAVVLEAMTLNGTPLADAAIDLGAVGPSAVLTARAADPPAAVRGAVIDDRGRLAIDYNIVVFTADSTRWRVGGQSARIAHAATDGTFAIEGLPAGEYCLVVIDDAVPVDLYDSMSLRRLSDMNPVRFVLTSGEQVEYRLIVTKLDRPLRLRTGAGGRATLRAAGDPCRPRRSVRASRRRPARSP